MKIKYLLLITLTLPAAPMFAMQSGGAAAATPNAGGNSGGASGWSWSDVRGFAGDTGGKIFVGIAIAVGGHLIKEWLMPNKKDPSDVLLTRDKTIDNTRQYVQSLRQFAATTPDQELAAHCLKNAAFAEKVLVQEIAFRNKTFAKLCGNERKAPDAGDAAPAA